MENKGTTIPRGIREIVIESTTVEVGLRRSTGITKPAIKKWLQIRINVFQGEAGVRRLHQYVPCEKSACLADRITVLRVEMKAIPISQSYLPNARNQSLYHFVFPLFRISAEGRVLEQIGTCFPITSSGVYATAAHLFRIFADVRHELKKPEILRHERLSYTHDEMRVGIFRFIGEKEKTTRQFEPVHTINLFFDHDIALLFSKPAGPPESFPRFPIVERPVIGSDISILGYPSGENFIWEEGGKRNAQISLVESKGKLTREFPSGRDTGLAWFPCFETNARMKAGHSGGPAIIPNIPAVVGVNSSSGDVEHSIISWLGKVLDSDFELDDWAINFEDGRTFNMKGFSIRKMAELGLARII